MGSQDLKKIAAVIVTYNRKKLLLECISALIQQSYNDISIYVVDNASTDGTKNALASYVNSGTIHYVNTGSNLGGAGGFNFGINLAVHTECDYIWVMDDDTIPQKDAAEKLVEAAKLVNDDFGFLSSYALFPNGNFCLMNQQIAMEEDWIQGYQYLKKGLLRIKRATFVSLLLKKEAVYKVGLPFKQFFIWGDDTEYTLRVSTEYNCYFVADSIVIHKTRQNANTSMMTFAEEDSDKLDRYYYNFRNWCYISKTYDGFKGVLREIRRFFTLQYLVIIKSHRHKIRKLMIIWRAYLAGIFFNPRIEFPSIKGDLQV